MRCPTLRELPPPPPGTTGWPWTEESPQLPDTMPDGRPWPRISIVTPNYNYGQFLEETIRSVLLQGYPDLEYIIIDGGSTDNSVEIIKKYEPWLAYWVSEPDRGQSHAINKGFERATGEIMAWINSDDLYSPCAFGAVAKHFAFHPQVGLIWSKHTVISKDGVIRTGLIKWTYSWRDVLYAGCIIPQETAFFRSHLWRRCGGLDLNLHLALDYDLWIRFLMHAPGYCDRDNSFAMMRHHDKRKTDNLEPYLQEMTIVREKYRKQLRQPRWLFQLLTVFYYRRRRWRETKSIRRTFQRTQFQKYLGFQSYLW